MLSRLVLIFLPRSKQLLISWLQSPSAVILEVRGGSREELPCIQGQGQWPRVPGCNSAGAAERSYPMSKVRGSGREELPTSKERWLQQRRRA